MISILCAFFEFKHDIIVVKVNNTNGVKTLKTNLNGNKQMIPSERAQKTVKNKPKNTQNH
jgi:hypothetical protein